MNSSLNACLKDLDNVIVQEDLEVIFNQFSARHHLQNATVLLTGCAGFLGFYFLSFLCRYAKELGIKRVIGLDNLKLGTPSWLSELLTRYPEVVQFHSFDVAQDHLSDCAEVAQCDYIIHMASIASPSFYRKFPVETIEANIWGLKSLLDEAKGSSLKGLLFFSSSEIYGDPPAEAIPTREDYRGSVATLGPRACYDESKRFGETLCYVYAQAFNMPIRVVRPFNNFGPGMRLDDKRVPADFAQAVVGNKDIVLYSDGTPTRTFCYITDAIVGYLKALTHDAFDVFNIGHDAGELSMKDLAALYAQKGEKIFNYSGRVRFEQHAEKDYLTHNPSRRCPDISKARQVLQFNPAVFVEQGVERYLRYLAIQQGVL